MKAAIFLAIVFIAVASAQVRTLYLHSWDCLADASLSDGIPHGPYLARLA